MTYIRKTRMSTSMSSEALEYFCKNIGKQKVKRANRHTDIIFTE